MLLPTASLAQTSPGDRYLCYRAALAKRQPKFSAVQKTLEDQLGALVADVKGLRSLCNPVLTAEHPMVRQAGYKTTLAKTTPPQPKFAKSHHTALDQFGSHELAVVVVQLHSVHASSPCVIGGIPGRMFESAGLHAPPPRSRRAWSGVVRDSHRRLVAARR